MPTPTSSSGSNWNPLNWSWSRQSTTSTSTSTQDVDSQAGARVDQQDAEERVRKVVTTDDGFDAAADGGEDGPTTIAEGTTGRREAKTNVAGVDVDGFVEGPAFKLSGGAGFKRSGLGVDVDVNLKLKATLGSVGGHATKTFEFDVNGEHVKVSVNLGAEGRVGINGDLKLKLHVAQDGVKVTAAGEGFAGARGTLGGEISVEVNRHQLLRADLKVAAAVGVMGGASFSADRNGFRAQAYAAAGVGMGVSMNGEWDMSAARRAAGGLVLPGEQGW